MTVVRSNPFSLLFMYATVILLASLPPNEGANVHSNIRREDRKLLGGYHTIDPESEGVQTTAQFAFASLWKEEVPKDKYSFVSDVLAVPLESPDSEDWKLEVLSASQQVVAGLNSKLTIAIFYNTECIGGFDVIVYNHFGDLSVINWGAEISCEDIENVLSLQDEQR